MGTAVETKSGSRRYLSGLMLFLLIGGAVWVGWYLWQQSSYGGEGSPLTFSKSPDQYEGTVWESRRTAARQQQQMARLRQGPVTPAGDGVTKTGNRIDARAGVVTLTGRSGGGGWAMFSQIADPSFVTPRERVLMMLSRGGRGGGGGGPVTLTPDQRTTMGKLPPVQGLPMDDAQRATFSKLLDAYASGADDAAKSAAGMALVEEIKAWTGRELENARATHKARAAEIEALLTDEQKAAVTKIAGG